MNRLNNAKKNEPTSFMFFVLLPNCCGVPKRQNTFFFNDAMMVFGWKLLRVFEVNVLLENGAPLEEFLGVGCVKGYEV